MVAVALVTIETRASVSMALTASFVRDSQFVGHIVFVDTIWLSLNIPISAPQGSIFNSVLFIVTGVYVIFLTLLLPWFSIYQYMRYMNVLVCCFDEYLENASVFVLWRYLLRRSSQFNKRSLDFRFVYIIKRLFFILWVKYFATFIQTCTTTKVTC